MFSHLTAQLRDEVDTVRKALTINESLRDLLISKHSAISAIQPELRVGASEVEKIAHAVSQVSAEAPAKLDWQIYDHCAALTRLYAVYERFVGDLVTSYVRVLPMLYKYADLPLSITKQHRIGIGHILLKIGEKGPFKNLEEHTVVRELAAGVGGSSEYTLLADAFLVDRQNLRFETLSKLFSALGFKHCGRYINRHSAVTSFIKAERADSSSAQNELQLFIDYRNEAAHRQVENVLAIDAIAAIGRFLTALGYALVDMVEERVLQRRMELGQYSVIMTVSEVHFYGNVVIGTPRTDVRLAVGDQAVVFGENECHPATLQSIQLNGRSVQDFIGDGETEVGLRLSRTSQRGAELRKIEIPILAPAELQLTLADAMAAMTDQADTDTSELLEPETLDIGEAGEEAGSP